MNSLFFLNPPAGFSEAVNAGKIELYDPQGNSIPLIDNQGNPFALKPNDLTATFFYRTDHNVLVGVPKNRLQYWGRSAFMVSLQDNGAPVNNWCLAKREKGETLLV